MNPYGSSTDFQPFSHTLYLHITFKRSLFPSTSSITSQVDAKKKKKKSRSITQARNEIREACPSVALDQSKIHRLDATFILSYIPLLRVSSSVNACRCTAGANRAQISLRTRVPRRVCFS